MSTCQLFHPANTDEGYVAVLCHRPRDLNTLLALGFYRTAQEAVKAYLDAADAADEALGDTPTIPEGESLLETLKDALLGDDDEKPAPKRGRPSKKD